MQKVPQKIEREKDKDREREIEKEIDFIKDKENDTTKIKNKLSTKLNNLQNDIFERNDNLKDIEDSKECTKTCNYIIKLFKFKVCKRNEKKVSDLKLAYQRLEEKFFKIENNRKEKQETLEKVVRQKIQEKDSLLFHFNVYESHDVDKLPLNKIKDLEKKIMVTLSNISIQKEIVMNIFDELS